MGLAGLPWRADVHDALLAELLGAAASRPGCRPPRLAELASQISAAFGGRPVNPDSPGPAAARVRRRRVRVPSTRSAVLREVDHPAVPLLLEYKELARLHAAHGWAWLDEWVAGGRFRPEYVVGGVVSGRWATRGGGALQIPRVLRRAVVADPAGCWWSPTRPSSSRGCWPRWPGTTRSPRRPAAGDLYAGAGRRVRRGPGQGQGRVAVGHVRRGGRRGRRSCWPCCGAGSRWPTQYVEAAARAGEEGRVVRSRLGRTCPPPSAAWRGLTAAPDDPDAADQQAGRSLRARGRFTRNFVVQASAADWALVLLAGLRRRLAALSIPNEAPPPSRRPTRGRIATRRPPWPGLN